MKNIDNTLFNILKRPVLYEPSPFPFWDDEYISGQMLKAHLDPEFEGASRNHAFLDRSAEWIASLAAPSEGRRLLDLGCGPGLYTGRFRAKGFTVFGIDISRRSIEFAKSRSGTQISYRCGSYLDEELPGNIDLAIMIYCDFGVLSAAHRAALLRKVSACLKPGGLFVFDVFTPRQYAGSRESASFSRESGGFWSPEEYLCFEARRHYPEDRTYLHQVAVLTAAELKYYNIWEHVFTRRELRKLPAEAGFAEVELYGDAAGAAAYPHGRTLCAVARKGTR
ncbi:MAG: class I SAM-dependent methyltransferase [Victivallaceae bacterium]|nr:class I SAM-dependent methyltransferase [Victivallaceae bacterium]